MVWSIEEQNKLNLGSSTSIEIQTERTLNDLHFSVVIHAFSNWLRYQVSYQPKNRYEVLFSTNENFLFSHIPFFFSFPFFPPFLLGSRIPQKLQQELKVSLCLSVCLFGTKLSRAHILLISGSYL